MSTRKQPTRSAKTQKSVLSLFSAPAATPKSSVTQTKKKKTASKTFIGQDDYMSDVNEFIPFEYSSPPSSPNTIPVNDDIEDELEEEDFYFSVPKVYFREHLPVISFSSTDVAKINFVLRNDLMMLWKSIRRNLPVMEDAVFDPKDQQSMEFSLYNPKTKRPVSFQIERKLLMDSNGKFDANLARVKLIGYNWNEDQGNFSIPQKVVLWTEVIPTLKSFNPVLQFLSQALETYSS